MKRSTIATTALALAASVFAGSAFAVTVTNVFENFSGVADGTAILGRNANNLSWTTNGTDNLSIITGEKLTLDTGINGLVTATIAEAATTNVAAATSAESASVYATFSAKVAFYPATVDPTIKDDTHDLKFALYALVDNNQTNLMAYVKGNSNEFIARDTGIDIVDNAEKDVVVTFTSNNFFRVSVNEATSPEFRFGNDGQISKVEFQGNGTVDDVTIAYTSALDNQEPVSIGGGVGSAESHKLTESEAGYLNNLVKDKGLSVVENALKGINEETFEKASLLNLDVTAEGVSNAVASADFKITSIKRTGNSVTVSVKLVRNGTTLGNVKGTVALYTCDTPNGEYTFNDEFDAELQYDANETTVTDTFTVSDNFFQVKIVDPSVISPAP